MTSAHEGERLMRRTRAVPAAVSQRGARPRKDLMIARFPSGRQVVTSVTLVASLIAMANVSPSEATTQRFESVAHADCSFHFKLRGLDPAAITGARLKALGSTTRVAPETIRHSLRGSRALVLKPARHCLRGPAKRHGTLMVMANDLPSPSFFEDWSKLANLPLTQKDSLGSGPIGQFDHVLVQSASRLSLVDDSNGRPALRVECRSGDFEGPNATVDRTEYSVPRTLWRAGDDVWYATAIKLDASSPYPIPGGWMVLHQFFAQDIASGVSGGQPPFTLQVTHGGRFHVTVKGGTKPNAVAEAPRQDEYDIGSAKRGVWYEFLIHAKWSTGADGLIEIFHRTRGGTFPAEPDVRAPGPNVLTVAGEALPVYAETGIYRSRQPATQVVYEGGMSAQPTRDGAMGFFK
jgi:hypothetical protein